MKILLIEDDAATADSVRQVLSGDGHEIETASDGRDGLFRATSEPCDLLIVDRMLPGMDGIGLVKVLRAGGVETPVMFLTAVGGVSDRVSGLRAGGDDYLVKPFAPAELSARVVALGRRPKRTCSETTFRIGDVELNLLDRTVYRAGREVELQPREFKLLEFLMRHAGQVVTRTMLLEGVWNFHFDPGTKIVESHMSRLRSKLAGERQMDDFIRTVRGAGYCIRAIG